MSIRPGSKQIAQFDPESDELPTYVLQARRPTYQRRDPQHETFKTSYGPERRQVAVTIPHITQSGPHEPMIYHRAVATLDRDQLDALIGDLVALRDWMDEPYEGEA